MSDKDYKADAKIRCRGGIKTCGCYIIEDII